MRGILDIFFMEILIYQISLTKGLIRDLIKKQHSISLIFTIFIIVVVVVVVEVI